MSISSRMSAHIGCHFPILRREYVSIYKEYNMQSHYDTRQVVAIAWEAGEARSRAPTTHAGRACSTEGLMCRDCSTLVRCTAQGEGFVESVEETCEESVPCDESTLSCDRGGKCRYKDPVCPANDYKKEEFFPDPYSFNRFYGCKSGEQYFYRCGPGLAYDPKKQDCSLPPSDGSRNIYPVLCKTSGQTGKIGDSDFHYECVEDDGTPTVIYPKVTLERETTTTQSSTSSSSTETKTSIPTEQTTSSTIQTKSSTGQASSSTVQTTSSTEQSSSSTEQTTSSTTQASSSTEQASSSTEPTTSSTEQTTSSTTQASSSTKQASSSTEPTTSSTEQTTSSTEQASSSTEQASSSTEQTTSSTEKTTTTTKLINPPLLVCKSERFFEDTENCTMFYKCYQISDGYVMLHLACRKGSYFDIGSTKCVPGTCQTTTTTSTTTTEVTPTTTTTPLYNCTSEGFFEDPKNCTMFFKCYRIGGEYVMQHLSCRRGSYFDTGTTKCVPGTCQTSTTTSTTNPTNEITTTTQAPTPPCHSEGYISDSTNCRCFVICYSIGNGIFGKSRQCCRKGAHFDINRHYCVPGDC